MASSTLFLAAAEVLSVMVFPSACCSWTNAGDTAGGELVVHDAIPQDKRFTIIFVAGSNNNTAINFLTCAAFSR